MARRSLMQNFARWHIWLGWIVGLPILMWTLTGLFMVLRPIEEVRGTDLRIDQKVGPIKVALSEGAAPTLIRNGRLINQRGRSLLIATFMDGTVSRIDLGQAGGVQLPPVDEAEARKAVAMEVRGGDKPVSVRLFDAARSPADFGKQMPAWQITLEGGTRIYVGRYTGEIEAVRTRWWRAYDFMWGLHILDPMGREDTSHPLLIGAAALSLLGALLGCVLLFRRRSARK